MIRSTPARTAFAAFAAFSAVSASRRAAFATTLLGALTLGQMFVPGQAQAASAQGSGNSATELRTLDAFEAVALSGAMDLVVRQGAQQSVQVQADDNLLPLLETVVEPGRNGSTLKVRWKRESVFSGFRIGNYAQTRSKVLVTVVVPKLSALATAGSGDVRLETFNTPSLQLSMSGSGDARLDDLTTEDLGIRISGSGDVTGKGSASRVKVSIAGSGDVRLGEMRADDVSVSIAGSGDAAVFAHKALSVSIAGSGDVTYAGDAQVKSSVAGSGSVRRK
jgi:carbon monoxide dehydrogenase subunit G